MSPRVPQAVVARPTPKPVGIEQALLLVGLATAGVSVLAWQGKAQLGAAIAQTLDVVPSTQPVTQTATPAWVDLKGREGFWRLGKDATGVWWFVSPSGEREFLNTVTTVQPWQLSRRAAGPHFTSRDFAGDAGCKTSETAQWATTTLARIKDAGFKGLGAWCHPSFHTLDVPITRDLNVWAHMLYADRLFYSPGWAATAEKCIREQVTPLVGNKALVGYYTDNELDWGDAGSGPARYFNDLPSDDPNRVKVIELIQKLWPEIASFNADWKLSLPDWAALATLPKLPHEPPEAYKRLFSAWTEQLARDYFELTSRLVRHYDPNHLVLGVRFKGYAPAEVARASRGHTDAQSLNYYVGDALLDRQLFERIHAESGQPLIITEYSFHSLDGRSGNRNTFGFGAQVLDQRARADGYRLLTARLARTPYLVGADWFQWNDEPPGGRVADGEDVNFGVVDVDDRAYDELMQAVRETTPTLNGLHAMSGTVPNDDVFRSRPAARPAAPLAALETKIKLDGELSEWSAQHKLPALQPSRTLGVDRAPHGVPNVWAAWHETGLYVALEVFDRDVAGNPSLDNWWGRDCVELFVSTRATAEDQDFYTRSEAQFFFVPIAQTGADGAAGVVGQWKRTGDATSASALPHATAREATRVFPDRYVTELFFPASALPDYKPEAGAQLAFNVVVSDYQSAVEHAWAAPKSVQTQQMPGTWGTLTLRPKMATADAKLAQALSAALWAR